MKVMTRVALAAMLVLTGLMASETALAHRGRVSVGVGFGFGFPGYWLKIGDEICVHLASQDPNKTRDTFLLKKHPKGTNGSGQGCCGSAASGRHRSSTVWITCRCSSR